MSNNPYSQGNDIDTDYQTYGLPGESMVNFIRRIASQGGYGLGAGLGTPYDSYNNSLAAALGGPSGTWAYNPGAGLGQYNNTPPPPGPGEEGWVPSAPGFDFTSYSDEDYQNLPVLRFLRGLMSPEEYASYAGGEAEGPFGTQLPLSGSMNMTRILEILRNPDAADILRSFYTAGNLNWDALVAMAAARAPRGAALPISSIMT